MYNAPFHWNVVSRAISSNEPDADHVAFVSCWQKPTVYSIIFWWIANESDFARLVRHLLTSQSVSCQGQCFLLQRRIKPKMDIFNSTEALETMIGGNDTDELAAWCANNFSIPAYLHPCVGNIFCLPNFKPPFENTCDALSARSSRSLGFLVFQLFFFMWSHWSSLARWKWSQSVSGSDWFIASSGVFFTFSLEYYR